MQPQAFDISTTFVHLGLGATVRELPDFAWTQEYLEGYIGETESDGNDGRLISFASEAADWTAWERHPAGAELVLVTTGRIVVIQDLDGAENRVELGPGQAVINPCNVWHTADVLEVSGVLFVTPGLGTEHRPRALPHT